MVQCAGTCLLDKKLEQPVVGCYLGWYYLAAVNLSNLFTDLFTGLQRKGVKSAYIWLLVSLDTAGSNDGL